MPDISAKNPDPETKPENPEQAQQNEKVRRRAMYLKSLNLAVEFGFIVVIPLLGFSYLGKYLDHRYHTTNKIFMLAGVVLALIVTCIWFFIRIKDIMKDMDN